MTSHIVLLSHGKEVRVEIPKLLNYAELRSTLDALEPLLKVASGYPLPTPPVRKFTAAHLRVVFLLAESQGSTHTRLSRAWLTKASRPGDRAWPWISDSGLRTRTAELVAWGLVEWGGAWGETAARGRSRIWQLTGVNPAAAGRDVDEVPDSSPDAYPALLELRAEAGTDVTIRAQLDVAAEVAGLTL